MTTETLVVSFFIQFVVGGAVGWWAYNWGYSHGRRRGEGVAEPKREDPYRSPPAPGAGLPVVQSPTKVYCKDCEHLDYELAAGPICELGEWTEDPVRGRYRKSRSVAVNKNFDCKDYEEK